MLQNGLHAVVRITTVDLAATTSGIDTKKKTQPNLQCLSRLQ